MRSFIRKTITLVLILAIPGMPMNSVFAMSAVDMAASCHMETQVESAVSVEKQRESHSSDACCCSQCDTGCGSCVATAGILPLFSIDVADQITERYSASVDRLNTRASPPQQRPPLTLFI